MRRAARLLVLALAGCWTSPVWQAGAGDLAADASTVDGALAPDATIPDLTAHDLARPTGDLPAEDLSVGDLSSLPDQWQPDPAMPDLDRPDLAPDCLGAGCPRWTRAMPTHSPPARYYHAMAWDAARRVAVLFGGLSGGSALGDTWEWDGSDWREARVAGPSPRWHAAMAWDATRRVTVLFGGTSSTDLLDDTWEYDGLQWRTVATARAPSPRAMHGMAHDPLRKVVVLFGGRFNDASVWELDGAGWVERAVSPGPLPRIWIRLVNDGQRTLLFGGDDGDFDLRELWSYDGAWTLAPLRVPFVTARFGIGRDPSRGVVVLAAEDDGAFRTWEWDGAWRERALPSSPPGRTWPTMVGLDDGVLLFGGWLPAGNEAGDTWIYGR